MGFRGLLSVYKMTNFDAVYKQWINKGFKDQFNRTGELVRSIFENKMYKVRVMKCVNEMQLRPKLCYLTVLTTPACCKLLLGDERRILVAFTDNKSLKQISYSFS